MDKTTEQRMLAELNAMPRDDLFKMLTELNGMRAEITEISLRIVRVCT